jgi:hypothetical protein
LGWQRVLRFFIPAAAAAVVLTLVVVHQRPQRPGPLVEPASSAIQAKADDVQIAEELVASFDTLATLPTGEPVRFQCQQWMDKVTLSDKSRGLVLEQRRPRVEIVPISYETY